MPDGCRRPVDGLVVRRYPDHMSSEQIERAIATLRAAGHLIEAIPGIAGVYRVDERGARTDEELLAMVDQLGPPGGPEPADEAARRL
jgi:predicted DNA-binding transcriptional regulator YafY